MLPIHTILHPTDFSDLLGRAADSAGVAGWCAALDAGVSRGQLALNFEASDEYRGMEIRQLYTGLLHRAAGESEVALWLDQFRNTPGFTVEQLKADILASDEYAGGQGGPSDAAFLAAVYRDVLRRPVDVAAESAWLPVLAGTPRDQVALDIVRSEEAETVQVWDWYLQYLRRRADPSGLQALVGALQGGLPSDAACAALLGSDEYFARLGNPSP
jgi:hypothetical protein